MGQSDQSLQQALLYLQAAGFDNSVATRERLKELIQSQPALLANDLLESLPFWFDLDLQATNPVPPIVRSSIGYGRD